MSTSYINVIQILINQEDIFFKSVIFRFFRIFNGLVQTKTVKKYILTLRESVHIRSYSGLHFPAFGRNTNSNIIGDIKAVFLLFFLRKDFTRIKSTKTHTSKITKKVVLNALKKHLRGRKSLIRLLAFLCFLCVCCAFVLFIRIKNI